MRTLSKRIVSYLIEYLGEFKFIFKTILDCESGDQMGSFDAKNHHRKSHAWAPLMRQSRTYCLQTRKAEISLRRHWVFVILQFFKF
jgi:hypothetical protein